MKHPLHVCIVGAGIGGLCLAQGLKKNGIEFVIAEKDPAPDSRSQGYRLRIDHQGQTALTACLPPALFELFRQSCAQPSQQVLTINPQLETLNQKWVDDWSHDKTDQLPDLKADRLGMKAVLASGLEQQIHYSKSLLDYQEQADGKILVRFADGSTIITDLLVAADGINSRVRERQFPQMSPQDSGSVCFYGKTAYSAAIKSRFAPALQTATSIIFAPGMAAVIDSMRFDHKTISTQKTPLRFLPQEDYLYWAVIGQRSSFSLGATDLPRQAADLRSCLERSMTGWSPMLTALFELTPTEAISLLPVRTAVAMPSWASGHITALGDACHAMSPASGLGANSALWDATILTRTLKNVSTGQASLSRQIRDYEQQVRAHSYAAVESSKKGSQQLFDNKNE